MTTATEKRLVEVMCNGNGSYYVRCYWCFVTTRGIDRPDDLRLLAEAQAKGRRLGPQPDGTYRLTCGGCARQGR